MKSLLSLMAVLGLLAWSGNACWAANSAVIEKTQGSSSSSGELGAGETLATGSNSLVQARTDSGIFRAGSDTQIFLEENKGQLDLQQGVMLVASDASGRRRGQTTVNADTFSVRSRGTALIAYQPGSYLKITVLEGEVTVRNQALFGEFITLSAGQMLIISPAEKRLPDPVEVDIQRLVSTSLLVTGFGGGGEGGDSYGGLPTGELIGQTIEGQNSELGEGDTTLTALVLHGASPLVSLDIVNRAQQANQAAFNAPEFFPDLSLYSEFEFDPFFFDAFIETPMFFNNPSFVINGSTQFDVFNGTLTSNGKTATATATAFDGSLVYFEFGGSNSLTIGGTVDFESFAESVIVGTEGSLIVSGNLNVDPGISEVFHLRAGTNLVVTGTIVAAVNQLALGFSEKAVFFNNYRDAFISGTIRNTKSGGNIDIFDLDADAGFNELHIDGATISSNRGIVSIGGADDVYIDGATISGGRVGVFIDSELDEQLGGGDLYLVGGTKITATLSGDNAIRLGPPGYALEETFGGVYIDSSTLKALAGQLAVYSGAGIEITDSTLMAKRILLDGNYADAIDATLLLQNATLQADSIMARSMGTDGVLQIDGSILDASGVLKLFAGSSISDGLIFFTGADSTLNGSSIIMSAQTVEIDGGVTVNVPAGVLDVRASNHNYNGGPYGNFSNPPAATQPSATPGAF